MQTQTSILLVCVPNVVVVGGQCSEKPPFRRAVIAIVLLDGRGARNHGCLNASERESNSVESGSEARREAAGRLDVNG